MLLLLPTSLLVLCFCCLAESRVDVYGAGPNACLQYYYVRQRYYVSCGFLWAYSCTRYRSSRRSRYRCCTGWKTSNGVNCDLAICNGKTNKNNACQRIIPSGKIVKPDGTSVTNSGGSCTSPGYCTNCNTGFWAKNGRPYCEVCPQISYCDFEVCGRRWSTEYKNCARCNGYYGMGPSCHESTSQVHGCSAFNTNPTKTSCVELCSWRYTSTPCWPGECGSSGYKASCKCHPWFSGYRCLTITRPPTILMAGISLGGRLDDGNFTKVMQTDPNQVSTSRNYWLNKHTTNITVKAVAQFRTRLTPKPRYINKAKTAIGIVSARVTIVERMANGTVKTFSFPECAGRSFVSNPEGKGQVHCQAEKDFAKSEHKASVSVKIDFVAGGFVTIINLDRGKNKRETRHNYIQATSTFWATFKRDFVKPYNTGQKFLRLSRETAKSVSEGQGITASWQGWRDDDSQLGSNVMIKVQRLVPVGEELTDGCGGLENGTAIPNYKGTTSLKITKPGVYSVTLTVSDVAGNTEAARRFLTYDPSSRLEIVPGTYANFSSADIGTNFEWQHDTDKPVTLTFSKDRYRNSAYTKDKWLGATHKCPYLKNKYDDHSGLRTTDAIKNNQGVVRMEVAFVQYRSKTRPKTPIPYKQIDIFCTVASFNIPRKDGDTIEVYLRVWDYMGRKLSETKMLRVDSSPPITGSLRLTREGEEILVVKNITDLGSMRLEWDALDKDTGVKRVEWTISTEYSGQTDVVVQGYKNMQQQTEEGEMSNCTMESSSFQNTSLQNASSPECYTTLYHGTFPRHFKVRPRLSQGKASLPWSKRVVHNDVHLFIKVTVINWASLSTSMSKKMKLTKNSPNDLLSKTAPSSPPMYLNVGIPLGVTILALIIIIPVAVVCVRRRKETNETTGGQGQGHDNATVEPVPMRSLEGDITSATVYASLNALSLPRQSNTYEELLVGNPNITSATVYASLNALSPPRQSNTYEELPLGNPNTGLYPGQASEDLRERNIFVRLPEVPDDGPDGWADTTYESVGGEIATPAKGDKDMLVDCGHVIAGNGKNGIDNVIYSHVDNNPCDEIEEAIYSEPHNGPEGWADTTYENVGGEIATPAKGDKDRLVGSALVIAGTGKKGIDNVIYSNTDEIEEAIYSEPMPEG